jgi:hypothetical protein
MLVAYGAQTYTWLPNTGLSSNTGDTVWAKPNITTHYSVIGLNNTLCSDTAYLDLTIFQPAAINPGNS